jgi:hypothetical protein
MVKLDYTIESLDERKKLVDALIAENPKPSAKLLEIMADYLIMADLKKDKQILTDNRLSTINKRETSFEGLVSQFENGEDGVYNLINRESNKNTILQPKITITEKDLEDIPELRKLRESIKQWEEKLKTAKGSDIYIIKKALIEMRKEQYIIKNAYKQPISARNITYSRNYVAIDEIISFDKDGYPRAKGISLLDPETCSAVLCNYSRLKTFSEGVFDSDTWYFMHDFDDCLKTALADEPLYRRIVEYKIDGYQNIEVQEKLNEEFGINHSLEYISSLWRHKIPKMIASQAEDNYLDWYYLNVEKGKYKRCSRCGSIKLAHNKYFSKNKTSKDGFYSICKDCRNAKKS